MSANIIDDVATRDLEFLRSRAAAHARRTATLDQIYEGMINPIIQPGKLAIGDCATGCDYLTPERWDMEYLDLYFDLDAQSVLTTAGNAPFLMTMAPVDPWFVPVAMAVTVNDATDMDLDRRAFLTALTVDGCRQWDINTVIPTMATTQLIPSDKFDPRARNGCACPVVMAPYTNAGIGSKLAQIAGINRDPVGINIMVTVNFYGKKYSCCPTWLDTENPSNRPKRPARPNPPVTSSGATVAGRSPFAR